MIYLETLGGKIICVAETEEERSKQHPDRHDCANHIQLKIPGDVNDTEFIRRPFCALCGREIEDVEARG